MYSGGVGAQTFENEFQGAFDWGECTPELIQNEAFVLGREERSSHCISMHAFEYENEECCHECNSDTVLPFRVHHLNAFQSSPVLHQLQHKVSFTSNSH